ncbi:MAG: FHA domain-containing protein [Anaerolineales bacterium]
MLLLMFASLFAAPLAPASAQDGTQPDVNILAVDDSAYPQIEVYVGIVDAARETPVLGLTLDDFFVAADTGETLTLGSLSRAPRPLSLSAVLDLTGSVSRVELDNQIAAVEVLIDGLSPADRLGIIIMDDDTVQVIAPLDEDPARIPRILRRLTIREGVSGNVFWDGVGAALTQLENAPPDTRRVAIIMTDVSPGGASGDLSETDILTRALEANIALYGLYFEYEDDGIPPNPPNLPPELSAITEATGGVTFGTAASERDGVYTDDEALPIMASALVPLLQNEYRLTLTSPLPPDGQTRGLNVTVTLAGVPLPPQRATFVAGDPALRVDFAAVRDGDTLTLPYTLRLEAESRAGQITALRVFAIDQAGGRVSLGDVAPDAPTLDIEPGMVPAGDFRLVAEAEDSAGNVAQAEARITAEEALAVRLLDPPESVPLGADVTIRARVGAAERVQVVSLLADGAEVDVQLGGPSDEVRFDWRPATSGPVVIGVRAQDDSGGTALDETEIFITLGEDALEEASPDAGLVLVFVAFIAGLGLAIGIVGGLLIWRGRRRTGPGVYGAPSFQGEALPASAAFTPEDDTDADADDEASAIDDTGTLAQTGLVPPLDPTATNTPQAPRTPSPYMLVSEDGAQYPLYKGENTLGRHRSNTLQLSDESVSRYHATLIVSEKGLYFTDWQASHPSEINGVLLTADTEYTLRMGDKLRVGSTLLRVARADQPPDWGK